MLRLLGWLDEVARLTDVAVSSTYFTFCDGNNTCTVETNTLLQLEGTLIQLTLSLSLF